MVFLGLRLNRLLLLLCRSRGFVGRSSLVRSDFFCPWLLLRVLGVLAAAWLLLRVLGVLAAVWLLLPVLGVLVAAWLLLPVLGVLAVAWLLLPVLCVLAAAWLLLSVLGVLAAAWLLCLAVCLAVCLAAYTTGTGAERRGPRVFPGAPAVGSVVFLFSSDFSFGIDFCVFLCYSFLGGVFLWLITLIITIV